MSGTSAPEDDVVIEFDDAGEAKVIGSAVGDNETDTNGHGAAAQMGDDPQDGIDQIKRQLAERDEQLRAATERANEERRARAEAETLARNATAEVARQTTIASESQYESVVNALTAHQAELDALESKKAEALASGEYALSAKLDSQMSKVAARLVQLENGKAQIEEQRKAAPPPPTQVRQTQSEQNEAFLASLPPKSAAWIRDHPQFFHDESFRARVLAAAEHAERIKGLSAYNDAYFQSIEADLGLTQQQDRQHPQIQQRQEPTSTAGQVRSRETAPTQRQAPPISAAPSREVQSMTSGQSRDLNKIVLSKEEREMARILFPQKKPGDPNPDVVYAKQKMLAIKEGSMGQRQ